MHHWYDPMNIIMIIMTFIIAAGFVRSLKVKNMFATLFAAVSLGIFAFVDFLILSGV